LHQLIACIEGGKNAIGIVGWFENKGQRLDNHFGSKF